MTDSSRDPQDETEPHDTNAWRAPTAAPGRGRRRGVVLPDSRSSRLLAGHAVGHGRADTRALVRDARL
jgi:hypothetical protein